MLEITPNSIFTIEIIEQKPQIVEIIAPNLTKIDVIERNSNYSLMLVEGTNYVAEITEGLNYSINLEPPNIQTIEISEKVSVQRIETNTVNNITNNIDNLVVELPCDLSVYVGAAVYLKIDSGVVKAYNALADSPETSNVFGIVEEKPSATLAKVRFGNVTKPIFFDLDLAQEYYLSDLIPGHMVAENNKPIQIGSSLVKIGQPYSSSKMLYSRGGKLIVNNYVESTGALSFGFTGDIAVDSGDRVNNVDIIDNGQRFN